MTGPGQADPADEQARKLLAADDPAVLDVLWSEYADRLLAFAASILRSHADAEEVLQQVFLKAARDRRRLAKARSLKAYLFAMARNEAVAMLRRRKHWVEAPPEDAWLVPSPDAQPALSADEAARLLGSLPAPQREVIVLKIYRGMTFLEIADALGLSINTAASRYRYGLQRLREQWTEDST